MAFITVDDVRRASGASSSLISDTLVSGAIEIVEKEMQKWMNTSFVPKERIEIRDGNNMSRMFVMKNPLLAVREMTVNDSISITPSNIDIEKQSGKITLTSDAESATITTGTNNTFIKYLYGLLEESQTDTTTTAVASKGTSVSLAVSDETDFVDEDWVEIYGMDGKREVAQITGAPTTNTILVDQLVQDHESGSKVVKLQIPYYIKRYMEIEAGIYVALNAIGGTYNFNASYSLGELNVTKGVPYTHWRESFANMVKERKMRRQSIRIRPSIMVD